MIGDFCYDVKNRYTDMMKNILITGVPKSGKSTLLANIIAKHPINKVGFITKEIRDDHGRIGFEMETHRGTKHTLAHVNFKTVHQVSKYFVEPKNLESIIPEVSEFSDDDLLYLDEIGQMQLFSHDFEKLVEKFLNAENTFLATLSAVYQNDFTDALRKRNDVIMIEIVEIDREEKEEFVTQLIKKIEKARCYITQPERFRRVEDTVELRSEHGIRSLTRSEDGWKCSCDFFFAHNICSHVIATKVLYEG